MKSDEGLVQLSINHVLAELLLRVGIVDCVHGHQVRQPSRTRRGHFDLRLVVALSFKLKALAVSGMVAEAFETGNDENFGVPEPFREESGQDQFGASDEPDLFLNAALKSNKKKPVL